MFQSYFVMMEWQTVLYNLGEHRHHNVLLHENLAYRNMFLLVDRSLFSLHLLQFYDVLVDEMLMEEFSFMNDNKEELFDSTVNDKVKY
jgi:hypothetical protein